MKGRKHQYKALGNKALRNKAQSTKHLAQLHMTSRLHQIINSYDASAALDHAATIPASWYTNQELYDLELKTVFTHSWHFAARRDQLAEPGRFVTADIAGEPIVVVRGNDQIIRGFYNVCRHHAAAVVTE